MMLRMRRKSRQVLVGEVPVGGGLEGTAVAPVSIQTMAKASPDDVDTIVQQLAAARAAGCDIARVAVPDMAAAGTLRRIAESSGLPVVADIHFDYRLAVASARQGAAALRVNPGNLGGQDALRAVVDAAGEAGIPIRVGVNAGSLPKTQGQPTRATAGNMVQAALGMVEQVERLGFDRIKVSLKASEVAATVEANRTFAARSQLPLHLGVTEAGPPLSGAVRSAAALGQLLAAGIGDTIRVSLTAPPAEEVRVARVLLQALGLRGGGAVVSCPTCGRTSADVAAVAARVERLLETLELARVVAVMGCEVNGPGEARQADLGIAYGPRGKGLFFEAGQVVASHPNERLEDVLVDRLRAIEEEARHGR